MNAPTYTLHYPRKRITRFCIRMFGRALLPILFQLELSGRENFPRKGAILVVGNHTAAKEVVPLNIYSPW